MEKLSQELQQKISGEMKVRAAVLAKRQLIELLIEQCSHYLEKTDPQSHKVFGEIIAQYNLLVDQSCNAIL